MRLLIALLMFSLVFLSACGRKFGDPKIRLRNEYFRHCGEVQDYVRRQLKLEAAMAEGARPTNAAMSTPGAVDTGYVNVQEKGVDEADYFRVGDHHLYFARGKDIVTVDRRSLAYLGSVPTSGLPDARLYTEGDNLIVLGSPWNGQTVVHFYRAAEGQAPVLTASKVYAGRLVDSRYLNGHLVLALAGYLFVDYSSSSNVSAAPVRIDADGLIAGVSCARMTRPLVEDFDFSYTQVLSIDARSPDKTNAVSALGSSEFIYMTPDSLYLAKSRVAWSGRDQKWDSTVIHKIAVNADGSLAVSSVGLVPGQVLDNWSFKELADGRSLAVATTVGKWSQAVGMENRLTVLAPKDGILEKQGAVIGLGKGEDIRAVRYVGAMAYLVTFKKTDPLFAIDLSDPKNPRLRGELVMPGFSMYLHPVADGRLLGVGFDVDDMGDFAWAQGLQISLFDTTDPARLARLDNKILGTRGSYSGITSDAHAFFFDSETGLIGIPAVEFGGDSAYPLNFGNQLLFSGAVFYRLGKNALSEAARISHARFNHITCNAGTMASPRWWATPGRSIDIDRVARIDGRLISVSRFAITTNESRDPASEISATEFPAPDWEDVCGPRWHGE